MPTLSAWAEERCGEGWSPRINAREGDPWTFGIWESEEGGRPVKEITRRGWNCSQARPPETRGWVDASERMRVFGRLRRHRNWADSGGDNACMRIEYSPACGTGRLERHKARVDQRRVETEQRRELNGVAEDAAADRRAGDRMMAANRRLQGEDSRIDLLMAVTELDPGPAIQEWVQTYVGISASLLESPDAKRIAQSGLARQTLSLAAVMIQNESPDDANALVLVGKLRAAAKLAPKPTPPRYGVTF